MADDLITIGKVLKHRGLKGELKVLSLTDFSSRFSELKDVILTSPDGRNINCKVKGIRLQKGFVLLSLEGCDTIEKAEGLKNWLVRIPQDKARRLPDGQYYWFDLLGMKVYSDSGLLIGDLIDIFATGSNDVFVVKGMVREHLVPATREVVKDVDVQNKRMTIHIIKGLLEEDEM